MSGVTALRAANDIQQPNDLDSWWLPFTANKSFKSNPRMVSRAKRNSVLLHA